MARRGNCTGHGVGSHGCVSRSSGLTPRLTQTVHASAPGMMTGLRRACYEMLWYETALPTRAVAPVNKGACYVSDSTCEAAAQLSLFFVFPVPCRVTVRGRQRQLYEIPQTRLLPARRSLLRENTVSACGAAADTLSHLRSPSPPAPSTSPSSSLSPSPPLAL